MRAKTRSEFHFCNGDEQQLCGSANLRVFHRGTSFCPLKYMLDSHWLVRAGCMWLPWKDALRAACEASSSNHGAGLALAGDSMRPESLWLGVAK